MKATATKSTPAKQASTTSFFDSQKSEGQFFGDNKVASDDFFPVQAKLSVGAPNDKYEQEADATADRVVKDLSRPKANQGTSIAPAAAPHGIQHKCTACEAKEKEQPAIQRKPIFESDADGGEVQRKCASCGKEGNFIQRKADLPDLPDLGKGIPKQESSQGEGGELKEESGKGQNTGKGNKKGAGKLGPPPPESPEPEPDRPPEIQTSSESKTQGDTSGLSKSLNASKNGGSPLSRGTQSKMENSFGRADFSNIRIHNDSNAVQMNRSLGSRAFTHGSDIYFNNNEYNTESKEGNKLLAHELTHTIQQGATENKVQAKFQPEPNNAALEGNSERPNDGANVESKMDSKIKNDPYFDDDAPKTKSGMSVEDKEKSNPDRGEVRKENSEVQASGQNKPEIDRGAIAEEKTDGQKAELLNQIDGNGNEGEQAEGKSGEKNSNLAAADAAAARALTLQKKAEAIKVPEKPKPFKHPLIERVKDPDGEPLPPDPDTDTKVRGLGYIGEMLREEGYEKKKHAVQYQRASLSLEAVHEKQKEDQSLAEEGTKVMHQHKEERKGISEEAKKGLEEGKSRQAFVEAEAPKIAAKAAEGKEDSSALKSDASSKAEKSKSEIPNDQDAKADAEKQSGDMTTTSEGADSMDEAIDKVGEDAKGYQAEAEKAKESNMQTEAEIKESDNLIAQTEAQLAVMDGKNAGSKTKIKATAKHPNIIQKYGQERDSVGDKLIKDSYVMEDGLNSLQDDYLAKMRTIPTKKQTEEELKKNAPATPPSGVSRRRAKLFEFFGKSEEEQEIASEGMSDEQKKDLEIELDLYIAEQEKAEAEQNKEKDSGGDELPSDPRMPQINIINTERQARTSGIQTIADKNFSFLRADQKAELAARLSTESLIDDVKGISIQQMGREMIKGMINPLAGISQAVDGFKRIGAGFSAIADFDAWAKDPLGQLLKVVTGITTGLATVFSAILGIAGMIMALMFAITVASWGFALPFTGPVMGWMGTIMTYAGWGAIITGSLAAYFSYLSYIKNLHDAATAQTSQALFDESKEMKQNVTDGLTGAMAVVEGIGAVKMGPALANKEFLTPNASKLFKEAGGKFTREVGKEFAKELVVLGVKRIVNLPANLVGGASRLLSGGVRGMKNIRTWFKNLFSKKKKVDLDTGAGVSPGKKSAGTPNKQLDTPEAKQRHKEDLDTARSKEDSKDLSKEEFRSEMHEASKNSPKKVKDRELTETYDIEIEANGHTYRRRKDGKGWCRFSRKPNPKECGISEFEMPPEIRRQLDEFDDDLTHFDDPDLSDIFDDTAENIEKARKEVLRYEGGARAVSETPLDGLGDLDRICFESGTNVSTSNGLIAIEKIKVGDLVHSYNFEDSKIELKQVLRTHSTFPGHCISVRLDNEILMTTGVHPFWVENIKEWIPAKSLRKGMILKKMDGRKELVLGIEFIKTEIETFNISVKDNHNYFVGQYQVLVHNSAKGSSGFRSRVKKKMAFYKFWDKVEGKYIYVGKKEFKNGSAQQAIESRLKTHRSVKDQPWKKILDQKMPDGTYRVETRLIGEGELTRLEGAITEKFHLEKNGGLQKLENLDPIINEASYDAHRHRFNAECIG